LLTILFIVLDQNKSLKTSYKSKEKFKNHTLDLIEINKLTLK